jgi:hypothetical protein
MPGVVAWLAYAAGWIKLGVSDSGEDKGIRKIVDDVVTDLVSNGVSVPGPLAIKKYSGKKVSLN